MYHHTIGGFIRTDKNFKKLNAEITKNSQSKWSEEEDTENFIIQTKGKKAHLALLPLLIRPGR